MAFPVGSSGILSTLDPDLIEDGRADIYKWSETRRSKRKGFKGKLYQFKKLFIDKSILRTFVYNLTVILFLQMVLAALGTFMCQKLRLDFDVHMSIFVSPIVFPLAFSINADFQRRERVLEDLAQFKGALLILFFCHRDWLHSAGLPKEFLKTVNNKLKGLVLNIKEFLLTEKHIRRNFILSVIYEDLSDISQLNDKMRVSSLPHNEPLITRLIHYHNLMCHAFERLRVIREYRSPRTIRSFTKVFIFLMPIVLSPYYVHMGIKSGNTWSPYYIAVLTSFIFGTLQGVQDVLDDPFDGISEDDINLGPLEDWTCQSLLTDRTITVGRFTVTTKGQEGRKMELSDIDEDEGRSPMPSHPVKVPHKRKSILRKPSFRKEEHCENFAQAHRTAPLYPAAASRIEDLTRRGLTGSTTILPGMKLKRSNSDTLMANASSASLDQEFRRAQEADGSGRDSKRVTFLTESRDLYDGDDESEHGNSVFVSTRSLSDPPKYSRPTWRSDESEPLILLDSRSGSSDMGTSALNTPDRERKNLGLDFYEGLNKSPGTSLVDARKVKKHSNPPLANLFSVNSVESADCADGPVPPKPSQPISMPSSLQNLFGSPQNQKLDKPPSGSKSFSSERPRPFALPMSPLAREESSSSSRSFPAPRVSRSAPCSPEQERRNSFRQISDPVTPSHENAAVLSSKPRTRQRKTSANIPLSKNSGDSPSGNSRFAVDTTSRTPTVQEAESLLSPSRRKSSFGSSRLLVSPDPQAPAVNNSAQVAQAPLADENFSIETPAPSKPVNTPISRFNVAKRSNSVIDSEREDKPLVSSNIPNYGLTDSSPPPSRFKVNSPQKISQETKQQSEDEEEPDSFQLLTVDGGSTEVFI